MPSTGQRSWGNEYARNSWSRPGLTQLPPDQFHLVFVRQTALAPFLDRIAADRERPAADRREWPFEIRLVDTCPSRRWSGSRAAPCCRRSPPAPRPATSASPDVTKHTCPGPTGLQWIRQKLTCVTVVVPPGVSRSVITGFSPDRYTLFGRGADAIGDGCCGGDAGACAASAIGSDTTNGSASVDVETACATCDVNLIVERHFCRSTADRHAFVWAIPDASRRNAAMTRNCLDSVTSLHESCKVLKCAPLGRRELYATVTRSSMPACPRRTAARCPRGRRGVRASHRRIASRLHPR